MVQHDDDEDDEDGVLHEERFERNPSKKFTQAHHGSVHQFQVTLSHIFHRLPFLKACPFKDLVFKNVCIVYMLNMVHLRSTAKHRGWHCFQPFALLDVALGMPRRNEGDEGERRKFFNFSDCKPSAIFE